MTDLLQEWEQAKLDEIQCIEKRRAIENEIKNQYQETISAQLDKDYRTGSATISDNDRSIVLTYPKRITWDQDALLAVWSLIEGSGDAPEEYIDRKFSVSESKYKNLPVTLQCIFTPARTVQAGNPTFKLKG